MDTNGLDALLTEGKDARPVVLEIIEGLCHDLEQADLGTETRAEVQALLADYEVRDRIMVQLESQLSATRATVVELLAHGYPSLPEREIDGLVYDDLGQNLESIVAAIGQFKRRVITTAGISIVGEEEPIP